MEPAAPVAYVSPPVAVLRISKITKVEYLIILIRIFFKFWRDRSRLNQNEILQENMRLAAFSNSTRCAHFCTAPNSTF